MTYLTLVPFLCKCRKIANVYINLIVKCCHSCHRLGVLKDYSDIWGVVLCLLASGESLGAQQRWAEGQRRQPEKEARLAYRVILGRGAEQETAFPLGLSQ